MGVILFTGSIVNEPTFKSSTVLVYDWAFKGTGDLLPILPVKTTGTLFPQPWVQEKNGIYAVDYYDAAIRIFSGFRDTGVGYELDPENINLFSDWNMFRFPKRNERYEGGSTYGSKLTQFHQRIDYDEKKQQAAVLDEYSGAVHIYQFGFYPHENKKIASIYHEKLYHAVDIALDDGRVDVLCADEAWLASFNIDGSPLPVMPKWCRAYIHSRIDLIDPHFDCMQLAVNLQFDFTMQSKLTLSDEGLKTNINLTYCFFIKSCTDLTVPASLSSSVILYSGFGLKSVVDIPNYGFQITADLINFSTEISSIRCSALLQARCDVFHTGPQLFNDSDYLKTGVALEPFFFIYEDTPNIDTAEPDIPRKWLASISVLDGVMLVTEGRLGTWVYNGYNSTKYTSSSFMGSILHRDTLQCDRNVELMGYYRLNRDKTEWNGGGDGINSTSRRWQGWWLFENELTQNFGGYADAENSMLLVDETGWNQLAKTNFPYYDFKLINLKGDIRILACQRGQLHYKGLNAQGAYEASGAWHNTPPENRYTLLYWDMDLNFRNDRLITQFSEQNDLSASGMIILPRGFYIERTNTTARLNFYVAVDAGGSGIPTTKSANYDYATEKYSESQWSYAPFPDGWDPGYDNPWMSKPFVAGYVKRVNNIPVFQTRVSLNVEVSLLQSGVDLGIPGYPVFVKGRVSLYPDDSFKKIKTSAVLSTNSNMFSSVDLFLEAVKTKTALSDLRGIRFSTCFIFNKQKELWRVDVDKKEESGFSYMPIRNIDAVQWSLTESGVNYSVRPVICGTKIWSIKTKNSVICHSLLSGDEINTKSFWAPFDAVKISAQKWEREYTPMMVLNNRLYYICNMLADGTGERGVGYVYIDNKTGYFQKAQSDILDEPDKSTILDMVVDCEYVYLLVAITGFKMEGEESNQQRGLWLYKYNKNLYFQNKYKITSNDFSETDITEQRPVRIITIHKKAGIIILGNQPVAFDSILAINTKGATLWKGNYVPYGIHSLEGMGGDFFLGLGANRNDWHWDEAGRGLAGAGLYNMEWHHAYNVKMSLVGKNGKPFKSFFAPMSNIGDLYWNSWVPLPQEDNTKGRPHESLFGVDVGWLFEGLPPVSNVLLIENYVKTSVLLVKTGAQNPPAVQNISGFSVWGKMQEI